MKIYLLHIFLFIGILASHSYAQKIEKNHINYTYGLSNSQITAIKQDRLGFIWVGTQGGGVYRWDGKSLNPLHDSLKYEIVRDVLPTPTGIWVLSIGKIFKVDQKNNIKSFTKEINLKLDTSFIYNNDYFFKIIPVANHNYLLQSISGKLILINVKGEILDVSDLGMFMNSVAFQNSIYFYLGDVIFKISTDKDQIKVEKDENVFLVDRSDEKDRRNKTHFLEGQWWVQKQDRMLIYDLDFNLIKKVQLPFSNHILDIKVWKNYVWIVTEEGLFSTVFLGDELEMVAKEINTQVYKLLETNEGLWVGTLNGVFQFELPKMYLLEKIIEDENINGYFSFEIVDGKLWAGSYNSGIHIYDGNDLMDKINFDVENMNRHSGQEVRALLQDGDSLWLGTSAGLFKIHKETHQKRKLNQVKSRVISLEKFGRGIAVGTVSDGLWIFNDAEIKHFNLKKGLRGPIIWTMKSVNNTLFIGSEHGLYLLENDSIQKLNISQSLDHVSVTAIEKMNESIIAIGYVQYGVYLYDLHQNQIIHHFHDKNGLSSSYIYFLKWIKGKLWVGSSLGIDIIDMEAPFEVFQLQDVNKLGGAETFLNGIVHYNDKVIASTIAGTVVAPDNIDEIRTEALANFNPIIIEKAESLSSSSIDDFLHFKQDGESLKIPLGQGSVKLHFNVAHFGAEKLKFIYQLEGYDETVSKASDEKFAIYKQLSAGNYTFKVWCSFNNKKVGDPATLSLIITTPFYKTDWFRAASIAFILAVIILFFVMRARAKAARAVETIKIREKAQDDLRKEMAIDFHDEMGNHLAKIINLSGVLKMWGLENEQEKVVSKIETAANSLFVSTRDLIWSLRKENNNLEEVFFHAKDFAESLLHKSDIKFRANKNRNAEHIRLNPKAARDLSMIIKEALTNVYKHSKAKNVYLNFEILPYGQAEISVIDDGCGFLNYSIKNGNGIKNMKQRALRSDFHLDPIIPKNNGCEIKIHIKLHKK